jgi:hypothetical protein
MNHKEIEPWAQQRWRNKMFKRKFLMAAAIDERKNEKKPLVNALLSVVRS